MNRFNHIAFVVLLFSLIPVNGSGYFSDSLDLAGTIVDASRQTIVGSEKAQKLKLTKNDILGKWKNVGITVTMTSRKMSKPYKPTVWHFRPSGMVLFTIGKKTNSFPYVVRGNEIITEPFRGEKRSFIVVSFSRNKMIWKDPIWNSYVHVVRMY